MRSVRIGEHRVRICGLVMGLLRVAQYNPQNVLVHRVDDISGAMHRQDIIALTGTMRRGERKEVLTRLPNAQHRIALHWGWVFGRYTNRACGVSSIC